MGILKKDASAKSARSAVTIIAEGNKFSGEMNIVGKMHIDGIFEGTIASLDTISIGKRGEVRGNIRAQQISVCGLLEGEIKCEELTVENGGRVRGVVCSTEMTIERKGCFVGERVLKEVPPVAIPEKQAGDSPLVRTLEDLPDRVTLIPEPDDQR